MKITILIEVINWNYTVVINWNYKANMYSFNEKKMLGLHPF